MIVTSIVFKNNSTTKLTGKHTLWLLYQMARVSSNSIGMKEGSRCVELGIILIQSKWYRCAFPMRFRALHLGETEPPLCDVQAGS